MNIRLYIIIAYLVMASELILSWDQSYIDRVQALRAQLGVAQKASEEIELLEKSLAASARKRIDCIRAISRGEDSPRNAGLLVDEIITSMRIKHQLCQKYPEAFYMDPDSSNLRTVMYARQEYGVNGCSWLSKGPHNSSFQISYSSK